MPRNDRIPIQISYKYKNLKIDNQIPEYFIVDGSDRIIFLTNDLDKLLKKCVELNKDRYNELVKSSNLFLLSEYGKNKKIIYFAMEGCKDCEKAEDIINKNNVNDKIIKVYTAESYGQKNIVDSDNLFAYIYNIDWYPTFILINTSGEYTIIRNVDTSTLVEKLR